MTQYKLIPFDPDGNRQGEITDFTALSLTRRVNTPGTLVFSVRGDHPLLSGLADRWRLELWRRPDGADWAREFSGLYRYGSWRYGQQSRFTAYCPGVMSLLARRHVAWYAGTDNRSKFAAVPAETIMKTLVTYNITSSATVVNGRLRAGTNWPAADIALAASGGAGNSLTYNCAYKNLLEALQEIAPVAGGDFDLLQSSATGWTWTWYTGQLGTDRSATVVFSLSLGNMAEPQYEDNRTDEATAAIVAGRGEQSEREIVIRTGANYSTTNDIEIFVDAADMETTAGLNSRGDQKLREREAARQFTFRAIQTPAMRYGVQYYLGDLVKTINPFNGDNYTMKVKAVRIGLDEGGAEEIETEITLP